MAEKSLLELAGRTKDRRGYAGGGPGLPQRVEA